MSLKILYELEELNEEEQRPKDVRDDVEKYFKFKLPAATRNLIVLNSALMARRVAERGQFVAFFQPSPSASFSKDTIC